MAEPTEPAEPGEPTELAEPGDLTRRFLELFMFLVLLFYAVLSIAEIEARDNYLGQLQNRINSINRELAQNDSSSETESETESEARIYSEKRLYRNEESRARVESLIVVGASHKSQTLPAIMEEDVYARREISRPAFESPIPAMLTFFFGPIFDLLTRIARLSSNSLLAIAIMTCGTIGGMIASFRKTGRLTWNGVVFGLASGFIVFLSIKGGRHIFLLQTQGLMPQFNPYTSSFLGLIAGMFTERTFQFLGAVIDVVFNKLKKVLEE